MNVNKTSSHKHTPLRTCVVCRDKADKRILTRIVRTADGIWVDATGKMNGRGAYICDKTQCWERIMHSDVLNKALKTQLTDVDYGRLQNARP